jgi:UPF0716 protein FxsA
MARGWLFLLILMPVLEIGTIIAIGRWIGGWQTLLLLILVALAGAYMVRREWRLVWHNASQQWAMGQMPSGEILDGLCLMLAGALLLLPGLLSDVAALFLLIPLTRTVAKGLLLVLLKRLLSRGTIRFPRP